MKHAILAIAFATSAVPLGTSPAAAGEIQIQVSNPVVELSMTEIVRTAPDIAQMGAGVMSQASTAREALRQNNRAMERIVERLRSLGFDRKDIQTSNFNLNPQYRYDRENERQVFTGYQVSNNVNVVLRDLERAGEVLDALVQAGANNIYGPNFGLEDDVEAKEEARKKAFERGMKQATDYARMAGYSGVRLLEVSENVRTMSRPTSRGAIMVTAEAAADSAVPVEIGEVQTGVTLGLKYEMVR